MIKNNKGIATLTIVLIIVAVVVVVGGTIGGIVGYNAYQEKKQQEAEEEAAKKLEDTKNKEISNTTENVTVNKNKTDTSGVSRKNSIVGTWVQADGGNEHTFNDNGTGSFYYDQFMNGDFTYSADGKELIITYDDGISAPFSVPYNIYGDTLTIIDEYGNSSVYKRIN